jgi:hypothetical protein
MTVSEVLDIDPHAARVFFRYGFRSLSDPSISFQTLKKLCQLHNQNLQSLLGDLEKVYFEKLKI